MRASIEARPVGRDEVAALEQLFATERTSRHCWCMAFCASRTRFAAGWFGGGNRRRFTSMVSDGVPMGVLAMISGEPVGWAACGPRSRYVGGPSRHPVLGDLDRKQDQVVWLVPCLFVHAQHRSQGVSHALLDAAVALARQQGAGAVEGWPSSGPVRSPGNAFVGREEVFADVGFHRATQPVPGRVIMRLDVPTAQPDAR